MDVPTTTSRSIPITRGAVLLLAAMLAGTGCNAVGPSAPGAVVAPQATPAIDASFRAERGGTLGPDPNERLDALATDARSGALLARSGDRGTCVFADGRGGWNRAAC